MYGKKSSKCFMCSVGAGFCSATHEPRIGNPRPVHPSGFPTGKYVRADRRSIYGSTRQSAHEGVGNPQVKVQVQGSGPHGHWSILYRPSSWCVTAANRDTFITSTQTLECALMSIRSSDPGHDQNPASEISEKQIRKNGHLTIRSLVCPDKASYFVRQVPPLMG